MFQVLIPTEMNLNIPQQANSGEPVLLEGTLSEVSTGAPVPHQKIDLFINGDILEEEIITDTNGNFNVERVFDQSGIQTIKARFSSVPYYWESDDSTVIQILSIQGSIIWIYPVILAVVIVGVAGGFYYYHWRKRRNQLTRSEPELPVEEIELEEPVITDVNGTSLKIEFPMIESPLPDVWGAGEELEVACYLADPDGHPLAAKSLQIYAGKQDKPIAQMNTDENGAARLLLTFPKKGQLKTIGCILKEKESELKRSVRAKSYALLDYREEIVSLF
jgi:hypothetical protein